MEDYRFKTHGMDERPLGIKGSGKVDTYKGAYISITNTCNTDVCGYCYARSEAKKAPMSYENFITALDWLGEISDFPEVYLVGGEPSLHPELIRFLDAVESRSWKATLYTNGTFNPSRCSELVNHGGLNRVAFHYENSFFKYYPKYRQILEANLEALTKTKECSLLFVISKPNFDPTELLELARKYKLAITWVFAAPSSGKTPFMDLHAMRRAGANLQSFLLKCLENGIETAPDLPVPLCVFEPDFLNEYKDTFKLMRRCRPFGYLKSDLSSQFCTAMPIYSAPRPNNSQDLLKIIQQYREADLQLKSKPSFPECIDCKHHLDKTCQGGCMTYKVYADTEQAMQ